MSEIVPNESALLQGLLNKVILYRFTRNLDKELEDRKISHAELSGSTGRSGNWFNRTFNELEDMRISTFIKSISAINKIISGNYKFKPVEVHKVLDEEMFKVASVSIDLSMNGVEYLLQNDADMCKFFLEIRFYVDALKALDGKLSYDEIHAYEQILTRINTEGN
ncbi:hypothetical protein ABER61_00515 [Brevibacillus formosus]|uniref:Uncharacterized protein n=1 Tax=Brevibacillus formosus TaxID=54913 RepID=A0A837KK07_9BACL|nr:hypothetical protein [Brevibacillus formosus]KLH97412.1 hypothetical protein AA984_19925 [Brevibacillus formosus]MED1958263.1 hypothetical protein [Brevibacillus formosus]PSJ96772.1 hypothetical protein C7R91_10975 [Brevibacillus formosus]GED59947.1 hypothetical protein BFO01nite_40790 [Brevibacillus formosus]